MTRYLAVPAHAWSSGRQTPESLPSCIAIEADPTPRATGVLDADGVPIYRVRDEVEFGFQGRVK